MMRLRLTTGGLGSPRFSHFYHDLGKHRYPSQTQLVSMGCNAASVAPSRLRTINKVHKRLSVEVGLAFLNATSTSDVICVLRAGHTAMLHSTMGACSIMKAHDLRLEGSDLGA